MVAETSAKDQAAQMRSFTDKQRDSQSYLRMKSFVSANLAECCKSIAEQRVTGNELQGKIIEASDLLDSVTFYYCKVGYTATEVMYQACERVAGVPVKKNDSQFDDLGVH